jgi:hypothetical protein
MECPSYSFKVWTEEVIPWVGKGYQFIGDPNNTKSAAIHELRNSTNSIRDLLVDVFMLSECDFIVCGISSTFCRMAVRLMLTRDPSLPYASVDSAFLHSEQRNHKLRAILGHQARDKQEINFEQGEIIAVDIYSEKYGVHQGRFENCYRFGKIIKSMKYVKLPSFKVEDYVETYHFQSFY